MLDLQICEKDFANLLKRLLNYKMKITLILN